MFVTANVAFLSLRAQHFLSLRVFHSADAKRRGRNEEVLSSVALPRQAKTGVSNGAAGARLRVWFWAPMEHEMVAEAAPRPDPAEQRSTKGGVRVWGGGQREGAKALCVDSSGDLREPRSSPS
jgi:hypothetical protein